MKKVVLLSILTVFGILISQGAVSAGTVDLITNGDFSAGSTGWALWSSAPGGAIDTTYGTLDWSNRSGTTSYHSASGALQIFGSGLSGLDVSGYDSLVLKYKITPIYQDLAAPGSLGLEEYPAKVVLDYYDTDGNRRYFQHGYSYLFTNSYPTYIPHTEVADGGMWIDYTSGDLFLLANKPRIINRIDIYGSGLNYSGSADDVQLLASTNDVVPEPATMSLLGLGLFGLAGFRRKK
ncbi:MAG: PEP-CTERM sorting domain-containing protein [Candidatus Omnitrophica bacterium]|nr:PEP-CTERM sorting domain-containing protein [Candidatus Omnitrophota bacterium]